MINHLALWNRSARNVSTEPHGSYTRNLITGILDQVSKTNHMTAFQHTVLSAYCMSCDMRDLDTALRRAKYNDYYCDY